MREERARAREALVVARVHRRRQRRRTSGAVLPPAKIASRSARSCRRRRLVERDADGVRPPSSRRLIPCAPPRRAVSASSARSSVPTSTRTVSKNSSCRDPCSPSCSSPAASDRGVPVHAPRDASSGPRARATPRTCRPSRPAAPAPCRCCSSPSRGGCAARASAAPCAAPACRSASRETPMMRPGHLALELVARGEERGVRAAVAERHAEALRVADRDVGAPLARAASSSVSASRSAATVTSAPAACARSQKRAVVVHRAVGGRDTGPARRTRSRRVSKVRKSPHHDRRCRARGRARLHHVDRLRMAVVGRRRTVLPVGVLDRRCAIVIASAAAVPSSSSEALAISSPVRSHDHRLEVEQRLEPALGDLRLVGRVRRVPAGVLQDVALDDRRA